MFSLLSELSTEQHRRNNQLAHNMIGEHFHTVSFLKNIMDQADIMTENTAIVISQESDGVVEVETNFEAKLVDYQLPTLFSKKMFFISKTGIVVGIQEKPSTRAIIAMMLDMVDKAQEDESFWWLDELEFFLKLASTDEKFTVNSKLQDLKQEVEEERFLGSKTMDEAKLKEEEGGKFGKSTRSRKKY